MKSFEAAYAEWWQHRTPKDQTREDNLAVMAGQSWESGSPEHRYLVLNFTFFARRSELYNVFREAMEGDDEHLSIHSLALVTKLLSEGVILDGRTVEALRDYRRRLPEWEALASYAMRLVPDVTEDD